MCFDYRASRSTRTTYNSATSSRRTNLSSLAASANSNHPEWKNSAQGCWEIITQESPIPTGEGYQSEGQPNPDFDNDIICGITSSLYPFLLVEALVVSAPVDPTPLGQQISASVDLTNSASVDSLVWNWGDGSSNPVGATIRRRSRPQTTRTERRAFTRSSN
jgi:hypothetical protein